MKRITLILSAATLALAPLTSSAGKNSKDPEFVIPNDTVTCNCSEPGEPMMVVDGDGTEVLATPITCTASWYDVVGAEASYDSATYGASFDVEWLDDTSDDGQLEVLMAELEADWSELCDGSTCNVPETTFYLTNFDSGTQEVEVYAAVKAFSTGKVDNRPRNFRKSRPTEACGPLVPADPV